MEKLLRYRYILWDADDTLLDFQAAENYAFARTMEKHGLKNDKLHHSIYNRINEQLWQDFNRGLVSKEALLVKRFEIYLDTVGVKGKPEKINESYLENLSRCSVLIDGALDIVSRLHELGVRQYVTTNAVSFVNRRRIGNSPLSAYIEDIFVSEDIGYAKPDRKYYDRVIERIGVLDRGSIITVGDSVSSDIQGGINAGIATCFYNPKHAKTELSPDYEVDSLCKVLDIVMQN